MPVVVACCIGVLSGLHAAHEARDESGTPLAIVHRDVSPQNVMVGADGAARVLDFGVAKAAVRLQTTRDGGLKGKLAYMAPEQLRGVATRASDVYACGVVLWEALTCRRLFQADTELELQSAVLRGDVLPPSAYNPTVPPALDRITARALAKAPEARYATALEMARDLDSAVRPASMMEVAEWVAKVAGTRLAERAAVVADIESSVSGRQSAARGGAELHEGLRAGEATRAGGRPVTVAHVVGAEPARDHRAITNKGLWVGGALALVAALGLTAVALRKSEDGHASPAVSSGSGVVEPATQAEPHGWFAACVGKHAGDACEVVKPGERHPGRCWAVQSKGGVLACHRLNSSRDGQETSP